MSTFPCIKFLGTPYENLLNNCGDSEFADNVYQLNDSVSWVKGKHNMKFGGEFRALAIQRAATHAGLGRI